MSEIQVDPCSMQKYKKMKFSLYTLLHTFLFLGHIATGMAMNGLEMTIVKKLAAPVRKHVKTGIKLQKLFQIFNGFFQ